MANEFKHKDPGSALTQAEFIASDGTGHIFDGQAAGDILYAFSTTVLKNLAKATDGNILELASGLPAWTASPTIGSTSWANANHAHAASNSGGTLTTVGVLDAGSITSNFGTINTGSSAISTTGVITAGGFTIGSAAITEAELEILDGATVTTAELNVLDALDRGSILYGNASSVTTVLGQGTADQVLTSDGTDISWEDAGGGIASVAADTTPQVGGSAGFDLQAQLLVGNGGTTGIAISANGEVTMAAQPCVLAYNSVTDSNVTGAGSNTTIDFDTEVFDQNGDFASDAFTAPIAGRYGFFVNVRVDGVTSSMNASAFNIVASNRTFSTERGHGEDSNGRVNMWISAIVDMDAADTVTIFVQNSGESGDVHDIAGDSNPRTFISVVKVA
jgi:hypothetical protein